MKSACCKVVWAAGLMGVTVAALAGEAAQTGSVPPAPTQVQPMNSTTAAADPAQSLPSQTEPVQASPLQTLPISAIPGRTSPQEPLGFITGGVIGGLAAGPVGAVIGAGIGTWLGNRVHRAGDAARAEAQVTALQADKSRLRRENAVLVSQQSDLWETNRALTARLDHLSLEVDAAQNAGYVAGGSDAATPLNENP